MNWKGHLIQFFTFTGIPLLGVVATWIALRTRSLDRVGRHRWSNIALLLFLATRLGTHVLVFGIFGYHGGDDLRRVWEPAARAVLEGGDPLLHLDNLYGPLFPLVLAGGLALSGGGHAPGIDLPFVIADGLACVLLFRIALRRMDEPRARRLTLAFLLCPLLWHNEVVRTQDESLFALFLLLALDLVDRGRNVAAALAAALGTLCTKALFPLWVLPVLIAGGGWRRILVRTGLAGGATLLGLASYPLLGWDLRGSFHPAIDVRGSSAWFLVPGAGDASPAAFQAGLVLTGAACVVSAALAARGAPGTGADGTIRGIVAVQAAFFVLGPFTLPPHLVQGLPFLLWLAMDSGLASARPPVLARVLAGGACLWQFPAIYLNSEFWRDHPVLIAGFVGFLGWTGWEALRSGPASHLSPGITPPKGTGAG